MAAQRSPAARLGTGLPRTWKMRQNTHLSSSLQRHIESDKGISPAQWRCKGPSWTEIQYTLILGLDAKLIKLVGGKTTNEILEELINHINRNP